MGAVYGNSQIQCQENYGFCGFNHDYNTPVGTVPVACFAEHLTDGHLPGVYSTEAQFCAMVDAYERWDKASHDLFIMLYWGSRSPW